MKVSNKLINSISVGLGMAILAGCSGETTNSVNVTNAGIYVEFRIEEQNGSASINAELDVGGLGGTNVVLSNGEFLQATVNGTTIRLTEDTDFLDVDYEGSINVPSDETLITIDFFRNTQDDILNSNVRLPADLIFSYPASNSRITSSVTETLL